MRLYLYSRLISPVAFLVLILGIACQTRKDPSMSVEQRCNEQKNAVWVKNQCVSVGSALHQQTLCEEKKDGSRWAEDRCMEGEDLQSAAQECVSRGDDYFWMRDAETQEMVCSKVHKDISAEDACKKQGLEYSQGRCVSKAALQCARLGNIIGADGSCMHPKQSDCLERFDGSVWKDEKCVSGAEVTCSAQQGIWDGEQKTCAPPSFLFYCQQNDLSEDLRLTVEALKLEFGGAGSTCVKTDHLLRQETRVFIENANISRLEPLRGYTQITTLRVKGNKIKDIKPLLSLTKLEVLDVSENQIEDIRDLEALKNLVTLNISQNPIQDFTSVLKLPKLKSLFMKNVGLKDVSVLANPQAIEQGAFSQLRRLYLSHNCQLSDAMPLAFLALEMLDLQKTAVTLDKIPQRFQARGNDGEFTSLQWYPESRC
jgi:hypothetical protein